LITEGLTLDRDKKEVTPKIEKMKLVKTENKELLSSYMNFHHYYLGESITYNDGFYFNDSNYVDDDFTVCSIKPYQLFLIVKELIEGIDARGMDHATGLGWMIDASHNVKDPLEDLLQSVEAIMISYAQALLVDRKSLEDAQRSNDVTRAQEILQHAHLAVLLPLLQYDPPIIHTLH